MNTHAYYWHKGSLVLKSILLLLVVALLVSSFAPSPILAISAPEPSPHSQPNDLIKQYARQTGTSANFSLYLPVVETPLTPIVPSTTKVLTNAIAANLISASTDGSTLTFKKTTTQPLNIRPGDIIASAPTALLRYGLLRKVLAISTVNNTIVVQTAAAALDEALQQGELSLTQGLSPNQTTSAELGKGITLQQSPAQALAGTFFFQIKDQVLYDADANPATTYDQVLANGSIEATPILNLQVRLKDFQLKRFYFSVTTNEKVKIKLESRITLLKLQKEKELIRYPLAPIITFIGILPLIFTPILIFSVGVDGDVHISLQANVTQNASIEGGMQYFDGKWEPIKQITNNFQYQPPTLAAGGMLQGYAGPRFELLLYGIVGPQVKINAYLSLEANTAEVPWWKLYAGLTLSAEFRMEVLSHTIASYAILGIIGIKILLAHADTGIPQPISGLTYISGGQIFEVNLTSGIAISRGAAPPSGIVQGKDKLFWIDTSVGGFRILQANLDGSNESVVLTGEDFFARIPDTDSGPFTYGPSTLAVNADQSLLFFNAEVGVTPGALCYVITLDLATKALSNTNFWCGFVSSPSIAPDGNRATGTERADYPGWDGWIHPTYLYPRQGASKLLNYAYPLDTEWLPDGRLIYSTSTVIGLNDSPPDLVNEGRKITLADAGGSTIRDIDTNVFAGMLAVSPDQQQLAYITIDSHTSQTQALWLVNLDGSGKRKLADVQSGTTDLAWR